MNSIQEYKTKYIKYKTKYYNLIKTFEKEQIGGNTNYVYKSQFGSIGNGDGEFIGPYGLTQLADENIGIVDSKNSRVQIFDIDGNFIRKFGKMGDEDGEFNCPTGITKLSDGNIAVLDSKNDRVQIFDIFGNFIRKFYFRERWYTRFMEPQPEFIIQLEDGNILINDTYNYRIYIYDILGNYVSEFEVEIIQGITLLEDGNIAVSELENHEHKIKIIDTRGNVIRQFGTTGNNVEQFLNPFGLTQLADGNIVIADRTRCNIKIFDVDGNFISNFGSFGSGNGEFNEPITIIQLTNGNLAITDFKNNRVQIFKLENLELGFNTTPNDTNNFGNINIRNRNRNSNSNTNISRRNLLESFNNSTLGWLDEEENEQLEREREEREREIERERERERERRRDYISFITFGITGINDGEFNGPYGLTQLADGNVAIVDSGNSRIQIFDIDGNFIRKFSISGYNENENENGENGEEEDSQLNCPTGITQLSDGNIAVVDSKNSIVLIFDTLGNFIRKFGSSGDGDSQFNTPESIIQLTNSNILISDVYNNRIQIFDTLGNYISKFYFENPGGITQLTDGNIAICDTDSCIIKITDTRGNLINQFGTYGSGDGQFKHPYGITQLTDGNIIVTDMTNNNIQIFDINGNFIRKIGSNETENIVFNVPIFIIQLTNGNLAITDFADNNVQILKLEDLVDVEDLIDLEDVESGFQTPSYTNRFRNVTIRDIERRNFASLNDTNEWFDEENEVDRHIYDYPNISPTYENLEPESEPEPEPEPEPESKSNYISLKTFGTRGIGDEEFNGPYGITQLADGNIAVVDSGNLCIKIFDINGTFIRKFSTTRIEDRNNSFSRPSGITQLSDGNIAVVDSNENNVKIFDTLGNLIHKFGSTGVRDGQFKEPETIIQLDDNNILICDKNNNRMQIFDTLGNFQSKFGFVNPRNITKLIDGNIAVIDLKNYRITIIDARGNVINHFGSRGIEDGKFRDPYGLTQLANGNIAVTDLIKNNVQIFDLNGNFINKFGSFGDENDKIIFPISITQLTNGNLAVSEFLNNRIHIFKLEDTNEEYVNAQMVLNNISYTPYISQGSIKIMYININNEKIFDINIETVSKFYKYIKIYYPYKKQPINIFDTLYTYKNIILQPNSKPFFIFVDITNGERDEGIDAGGLTRTVFHELSKYLSSSTKYFEQDADTKLFKLKMYTSITPEHMDKLYFLGQLFGLAIKLKQIVEINLDPFLLYELTHNLTKDEISETLVNKIINELNPDLFNKTPYICYNKDLAISKFVCMYNEDGDEIDIDNLKEETTNKIKSSYETSNEINKYFISGFRKQINISKSKINKLPLKLLDELIAGLTKIDYSVFLSYLNFINFTNEQKNILLNIIKNNICIYGEKKYLEMLLLVMTGTTKIPSTGYPELSKLRFEKNSHIEPKPIDIHSCFNQFIINPKLFVSYFTTPNKEKTELVLTFSLDTLRRLSVDFSAA